MKAENANQSVDGGCLKRVVRRCCDCTHWETNKSGAWGTCRRDKAIRRLEDVCDHFVATHMLCEKCGQKLSISPNSKGALSYQGCNCHEPEWMQYE